MATGNLDWTLMACGKQISADLCQAIMKLLQYYNGQDVAKRTGVPLSSVYMIASDMVKKGGIPPQKQRPKGRFRALTEPQIKVSYFIYS